MHVHRQIWFKMPLWTIENRWKSIVAKLKTTITEVKGESSSPVHCYTLPCLDSNIHWIALNLSLSLITWAFSTAMLMLYIQNSNMIFCTDCPFSQSSTMVRCQLPVAPTLGWCDKLLMASDVSLHVSLLIYAFFPTSLSLTGSVPINCWVASLTIAYTLFFFTKYQHYQCMLNEKDNKLNEGDSIPTWCRV